MITQDGQTEGLVDLTQCTNMAVLMGQLDCFTLKRTTLNLDKGESGEVKLLYDIVFEDPKDGERPVGLLMEANLMLECFMKMRMICCKGLLLSFGITFLWKNLSLME